MNFGFYIFSYNRGRLLENCVKSGLICFPKIKIVIVDDCSDDPETIRIIERLSTMVEVIKVDKSHAYRLGGLYRNMQIALEHAKALDLVVFLQDDMQFVRSFDTEDMVALHKLTRSGHKPRLVYPAFLKRGTVQSLNISRELDGTLTALSQNTDVGVYYSDVFAARPLDLIENNWNFESDEEDNALRAASLFQKMAYSPFPIISYVPRPPAYRGRARPIGIRVIEYLFKFRFHKITILNNNDFNRMRADMLNSLPIAENFLQCKTIKGDEDWLFSPYYIDGWARILANFLNEPISYSYKQFQRRVLSRILGAKINR